jgi:tetratricopeptide (TPR) repeat protein
MPHRKWIWPLLLVSAFIFILSLRQLSDPDLGFHLKYGKWIVENKCIPVTDVSTYTVTQHPYTDLHWLFQVILYGMFKLTGYPGISLLVCFLSLLLSLMVLLRLRLFKIPLSITCIAVFCAFLVIDPRIAPRPEMVTFLLLTGTLFILDRYYEQRKNMLYLLPAIMLSWCNMHALFILGLIVMAVYFISALVRDGKPDKKLLMWISISFLACFLNPYGIKGFSLPVELLTRFDPNNIYNQHIQEFMPFFNQPHFVLRDYMFMGLLGITIVFTMLTFTKRKQHELLLLVLFGFLAVGSVRNIPLFVLISIPIICREADELSGRIRRWPKILAVTSYLLMIMIPMALIPRLLTNAWYISNNSFNKTGMGLNVSHQPTQASAFLLNNHLGGRILNSIGLGGWLSWALPQPVFIDGRLEVMQEPLYYEITESWNGGLSKLIDKYQPDLIIYNYLKYYPWTVQIKQLGGWRLIYADGLAAIFAHDTYAPQIPEIDISKLPSQDNASDHLYVNNWIHGFYQPTDYASIDQLHLRMFSFQIKSACQWKKNSENAVIFFNSANLKYEKGDISGALADFDRAIRLQPGYSKAYNNRGILRAAALKDYPGALSDFDKAIVLSPEYGDAYLGRGTVYLLLKNVAAACNDWTTARSLGNLKAARLIELHCARQ